MTSEHKGHVLVVPYPSQGHINPMLEFSKRLSTKGVKATFAIPRFIFKSLNQQSLSLPSSTQIVAISDGYDAGGFYEAESIAAYLSRMEVAGSKTVADLILQYKDSGHPIDCVIYDPFLPWALEVAKQHGLLGAAFFTQICAVNFIYYYVHRGWLKLPVPLSSLPVSIPGLPLLELEDTPSFVYDPGYYPAYFEMILSQYSNADKADWIFVNSFYKLESQEVDSMSKVWRPLLTIGPTVPSFHVDKQVPDDKDYDINLFQLDSSICIDWLKTKPERSVVYVSFGSMASLSNHQMEEMALGLKNTAFNLLWVVSDSERGKLPQEVLEDIIAGGKSLLVSWSPQLEVLSSQAVGCFLTHCGWNSTFEALCFGVPMVGMPQWTDQPTNAKYVEDVWKVGVRVRVGENGIVSREEIERCVRKVMEEESGREMRINAKKWKELAVEAVLQGGTSDANIDEFVSGLMTSA